MVVGDLTFFPRADQGSPSIRTTHDRGWQNDVSDVVMANRASTARSEEPDDTGAAQGPPPSGAYTSDFYIYSFKVWATGYGGCVMLGWIR